MVEWGSLINIACLLLRKFIKILHELNQNSSPYITAINFLVKWFKMFGFTLPNSLSIHVTFFLNVLVLMREVKCFKISSNLI